MSHVKIDRNHSMGAAAARERVAEIEPMLKDKYGVSLDWRGNEATVKGRGVTGAASITDDHLLIELKLGLLIRPLAGKIQKVMEEQLDRALTSDHV